MFTAFDFSEEFRNFKVMLDNEYAWQVVNSDVFSVDNMTDEELRQSIVQDVLTVTMWEKQSEQTADFSLDTLCRFLNDDQRQKVEQAFSHPEISGLFNMSDKKQLRIRTESVILQAAMDYVGVWFTGFEIPVGVTIIDTREIAERIGTLEAALSLISMDLECTVKGNSTIN